MTRDTEHSGKRPLRLSFTAAGHIQAVDGARQCDLGAYQIDEWCNLALRLNLVKHEYTISINDKEVGTLPVADASIQQVQRLVIRTGAWRGIGKENFIGAGTDIPLEHPAVFLIDDVAISAGN